MKLTIKTLQQNTFKIDIEPDKTVKELKDKIEKDHGKDYPNSGQKLIYSGKILADESKLSEYNIDEKKFLVLMITRPPPVQKPVVASTEPKATAAKKDEPAGTKAKVQEDKPKPTTVTSTTTTSSSTTTTTAAAAPATTATTTTVPTNTTSAQPTVAEPRPSDRSSALNEAALGLSMSEPQMAARLASMMTQPQFRQIQDLISQSPHLLSSTIESLAGTDPEMYSFISENPDVFVSALNHPPLAASRNQSSRSSTTGAQPARQGSQQPSAVLNPTGRQQPVVDQILVDVSEHDKQAIERLKELGFSEYLAVQAYMACDKDEQLAANLLFQMDQ